MAHRPHQAQTAHISSAKVHELHYETRRESGLQFSKVLTPNSFNLQPSALKKAAAGCKPPNCKQSTHAALLHNTQNHGGENEMLRRARIWNKCQM